MPVSPAPNQLAEFQSLLVGTWENQHFPGSAYGGQADPLSYNVMPLPQTPPQGQQDTGYILKNFRYYETQKFNSNNDVASAALAPNRGGDSLQAPVALFYEQQVRFAQGPGVGQTVHVENGAWLNLQYAENLVGPYPPPPGSNIVGIPSPSNVAIAKQVSVPHGNSIIALGGEVTASSGAPTIEGFDDADTSRLKQEAQPHSLHVEPQL